VGRQNYQSLREFKIERSRKDRKAAENDLSVREPFGFNKNNLRVSACSARGKNKGPK